MKEVVGFIKDGDTAVQIIPMLKEYLEINVKNDEQLVKLATIVQRLAQAGGKGESEGEFGLTEAEKDQLMKNPLYFWLLANPKMIVKYRYMLKRKKLLVR